MSAVHAGWLATQGMVRAAGGTISTVFRTVVGTTLGAISVLKPIFAAMLSSAPVNPLAGIQAIMGMTSIGLAINALIQAELGNREASDALRGANMALHGMQSFMGVFDFD